MHSDCIERLAVSQRRGHIFAHEHYLVINLASTNLAENIICKDLNPRRILSFKIFHKSSNLAREEASETLASLSHEISSAHFTRHSAAFSAGVKI